MSPSSQRRKPHPLLLAGVTAGVAGMLAYMAARLVPVAADVLQGTPSIDQLRRVDGQVAGWRHCHSAGRSQLLEQVTLETPGRLENVAMPCVMPEGVSPLLGTHHMTVLVQELRSVGPVVYDVRYDDRQLLAYADVKRTRDERLPWVVGAIVLGHAIVGGLLVFLVRQCWRTLRR